MNDKEYQDYKDRLIRGEGKVIFMHPTEGDDSNGGTGPDDAVLTERRAVALADPGPEIQFILLGEDEICMLDSTGKHVYDKSDPPRRILSIGETGKVTYRVGPCPFYEFSAHPDGVKIDNTLIATGFMCTGDGIHKCYHSTDLLPMCGGDKTKCAKKLSKGIVIQVKIERMTELKLRTKVALWLIRLAAAISWVRIEIIEKENDE